MLPGVEIANWFNSGEFVKEGYYSIKDTIGDIKKSPEGKALLDELMDRIRRQAGGMAQNIQISQEMRDLIDRSPLEQMLKRYGGQTSKEDWQKLQEILSRIPKN